MSTIPRPSEPQPVVVTDNSTPPQKYLTFGPPTKQCSRKRGQPLKKKRKKSCFLDFQKNVKNVKKTYVVSQAT